MTVELPLPVMEVIAELIREGPEVVWLAGSYARGDFARYSDVDLGVITTGEARPVQRRVAGEKLVSVSFTTEERTLASFDNPGLAGAAVPGWRSAVLLHDPGSTGARLKRHAQEWDWSRIEPARVAWLRNGAGVASELVLKLLNGRERGDELETTRQRNALVEHLLRLLAVHLRLMYDSESRLYRDVNSALGEPWTSLASSALGVRATAPLSAQRAALGMYEQAVVLLDPIMDEAGRELLSLARAAAEQLPR